MTSQPAYSSAPIHLGPDDYHLIGPEEFGTTGLRARESVGPFAQITAVGPLVTVHDSTFEPNSGIGHHPHRGMERLFYIVDGEIQHDDSLNLIRGTMSTGDLGILTEGAHGMVHSERNDRSDTARAYILVYPADPQLSEAAFDAIRDEEMPRLTPHDGVEIKLVVERQTPRIHGHVYEMADTRFDIGGALPIELEPGEGALLFCLDGRVQITTDDGAPVASAGIDDTVLLPPAPPARRVVVDAQAPSRVVHVVTGPGFGLRFADNDGH